MPTIQVVLDTELLKAANAAAKRQKLNRSALMRHALQQHLRQLRILELEERDRKGYEAVPQSLEEFRELESLQVWPED